jgi:hypothetical protein
MGGVQRSHLEGQSMVRTRGPISAWVAKRRRVIGNQKWVLFRFAIGVK